MELSQIREEIDKIDSSILELLVKRFKLGDHIALAKHKQGKPLKDVEREKSLIEDRTKKMESLGYKDPIFIEGFFRLIINKMLQLEEDYLKEYIKKNENNKKS
jgi:chorismate mutase